MLRSIVFLILDWIAGHVARLIKRETERQREHAKIEKQTKEQAENLKKSESDDEDEKAAQEILSRRK